MFISNRNLIHPSNPSNLAVICAVLCVICSCKKLLDVNEPNSKISANEVFSSDANANSAVVGMYVNMYQTVFGSGGEGSVPWLTGLSADELHNQSVTNPAAKEFEQNEIATNNSYIKNLWADMYKSVYVANAIIEGVDLSSKITPAKKNQYKGEALFVRSFCYFYLVNLFGDVPLVLTTDYKSNVKLSKSIEADVYNQIESDLLVAESLLPEEYPSEDRVRPNRSVVKAFLSRLYVYKKEWQKAADNATQILSQTAKYQLATNLNTVFLANSKEAIWQLKPLDEAFNATEGYIYNPQVGPTKNVLFDGFINSFDAGDKRKINWVISSGPFYLPFKYKLYDQTAKPAVMEYSMVFRLAEQYLIRAEARAQLGVITGNNSAISDVNVVRTRAGLSDATATNLDEIMKIIEKERKLELFTEWGHRWLDLKRWHIATKVLAPLRSKWQETDMLYPVPQSELEKNPYLKPQNKGY
jgi:hypothetical protein